MRRDTPPGPSRTLVERFYEKTALAPAAAEILWQANRAEDAEAFLHAALPTIATATQSDYLALAIAQRGRWEVLSDTGRPRSLPVDLLADVLDREEAQARDGWAAVPLDARSRTSQVILLHAGATQAPSALAVLKDLAPLVGEELATIVQRHEQLHDQAQRLRRLEAIVQIAQRWNQSHQMESLLADIAEAAARLLGADRASIFLWDRAGRTLVGRPALGVENNELRIPDDAGVVGQVVQTGQTRRVDVAVDPDSIDHQVDARLGYRTKTLLCVPLRGASGERFGAFELINKLSGSFTDEDEAALTELAAHAAVALENAQDREHLLSTNRQITDEAAQGVRMIGRSPAIEALRSITRRVADTELAVLILGENGTGKEVVAQSVHYFSRRRDKPFIAVNCAAIPDSLAESELFGHEKGAFTDAREMRRGKFELAAEGTLFLDEIGDLSLGGQSKLLRVLEEKVLVRVGGSTPIHTDARVVAATNQSLAEMVRQKRFREDLYFRLNVVTLEMPPLRDRPEDIMLLAEYFLTDFSKKARRKVPAFSPAARSRLEAHSWPGNVRELRNLMERLAYLTTDDRIEVEDLAFILSPRGATPSAARAGADQSLAAATAEFQIRHITDAIAQSDGNVSQAAARLGLHRSNLYRKMRQLAMDTSQSPSDEEE
jgi:Nif-specific regulatory protein